MYFQLYFQAVTSVEAHATLVSRVSVHEDNSKWETIDAKPMTEELHSSQTLAGHPQTTVMTTSDWSTYLNPNDNKNEKWISSEEKVVTSGWANPSSVSVLATPLLNTPIISSDGRSGCSSMSPVHPDSSDMIPVNPKDLVLTPSPMEVDNFVFRSNQVS